jgi:hypothetical protein
MAVTHNGDAALAVVSSNQLVLEGRRCGAGIDQRRRQLSGAKAYVGSIHHAHPPRLRRALFLSDGSAFGQLRMAQQAMIARALLR